MHSGLGRRLPVSWVVAAWVMGALAGWGRSAAACEPGIEALPVVFNLAAAETASAVKPATPDTSSAATPAVAETSTVARPAPAPAVIPAAKVKPKRATALGAGVGAAIGLAAGVFMVQGLNPGDSVLGFNLYAGPVATTLIGAIAGGIVGWFFRR